MMFKYAIFSIVMTLSTFVYGGKELYITNWDVVGPGPRTSYTFSSTLQPWSVTLPYTITLPNLDAKMPDFILYRISGGDNYLRSKIECTPDGSDLVDYVIYSVENNSSATSSTGYGQWSSVIPVNRNRAYYVSINLFESKQTRLTQPISCKFVMALSNNSSMYPSITTESPNIVITPNNNNIGVQHSFMPTNVTATVGHDGSWSATSKLRSTIGFNFLRPELAQLTLQADHSVSINNGENTVAAAANENVELVMLNEWGNIIDIPLIFSGRTTSPVSINVTAQLTYL